MFRANKTNGIKHRNNICASSGSYCTIYEDQKFSNIKGKKSEFPAPGEYKGAPSSHNKNNDKCNTKSDESESRDAEPNDATLENIEQEGEKHSKSHDEFQSRFSILIMTDDYNIQINALENVRGQNENKTCIR